MRRRLAYDARAMIRIAKSATIAIALLTLAVASAVFAADANTPVKIDTAKIIDLTYTFDASTIYWPDEKGFVHRLDKNGDTPEHYFYAAGDRGARAWRHPTDAPHHFNRNGITLELHRLDKNGDTPGHYFYAAGDYAAPEHGGTHTDAPHHFNRNGITLDKVPLADCIGPAAVIDFSARAAKDRDATLTRRGHQGVRSSLRPDSGRRDRRRALRMGQILSR